MPAKTSNGNGTTRSRGAKLPRYYERLSPTGEYIYESDGGFNVAEINVYDDLDAMDQIKVQVFPLLNGRKKSGMNATITTDSTKTLRELAADLEDAADLIDQNSINNA